MSRGVKPGTRNAAKNNPRTCRVAARLTPETAAKLKDLCKLWGVSKSSAIERLIEEKKGT